LKIYFSRTLRDCKETINNKVESSKHIENGSLNVERGTLDQTEKSSGK